MSERTIRVQPTELEKESGNVRSYKSNFSTAYSDISTQATNITTTSWGGKDAEAFKAKVDDFKKDFKAMEDILEEYAGFLHKASEAYANAQDNVTIKAGNLVTKI